MRKVYNVIDTIITVSIIAIALVMVVPLLFNIRSYVVMSSSMEPVFGPGAVCFIDRKDTAPQKGDIIAYSLSEELITHRVIDVDADGNYITKGDNNDVPDLAPVTPAQVVGKNIFWIPYFGYFIVWIQKPIGYISFIVLIVAYIIFSRIVLSRKEYWNENHSG